MKNISFLALSLAIFSVGCSDPTLDEPMAVSAPPADAAAVSVIEPLTAQTSSPLGIAQTMTPAAPSDPLPEKVATEQTLHTVNMFLIEYQAGGGKIPATVEELVMQKIVPKLPSPPAGKRFEIDQQKAVISLADI